MTIVSEPRAISAVNDTKGEDGGARRLTREQVVLGAEGSVALIRGKTSSGTGFLVRPSLLVTNSHVLRREFTPNLKVYFPSSDERHRGPLRAELRAEDEARDLAFLDVKTDLPPLPLDGGYQFLRGQDVTLIGNPGVGEGVVLPNAVNRGVMSTLALINGKKYYQIGMSLNPGDSGGPVLSGDGKVVGVATLRAAKQEGLAFCIPVEDLQASVERLDNVSASRLAETRSLHRAKVLVRSLNALGNLYAQGLDQCSTAWVTALERRLDPQPVLSAVSHAVLEQIRPLVKKGFPDLNREWERASTDSRLAATTRDDLAELWTNVGAMRSYMERPRGDLDAYRGRVGELKRTQARLVERLKRRTGIVID
jgi:serine protease Do